MCAAVQEAKFLMQLLRDTTEDISNKSVVLNVNNQSTMELSKNPVFHQRSKHIDIKYHFVRSEVQNCQIRLEYIPSNKYIADMFTKSLSAAKIETIYSCHYCCSAIAVFFSSFLVSLEIFCTRYFN
jgi:hypothetical protein